MADIKKKNRPYVRYFTLKEGDLARFIQAIGVFRGTRPYTCGKNSQGKVVSLSVTKDELLLLKLSFDFISVKKSTRGSHGWDWDWN